MPTSAAGSNRASGFTLLELLIVVALMALATAGVSLSLRDTSQTLLDREATRLAAVLEAARAQSRASGLAIRWISVAGGYRLEGLPPTQITTWLDPLTQVRDPITLVLGPEPLIGPQSVTLIHGASPDRALRVTTDGLRPFTVEAVQP